jgi:hypothetical protein
LDEASVGNSLFQATVENKSIIGIGISFLESWRLFYIIPNHFASGVGSDLCTSAKALLTTLDTKFTRAEYLECSLEVVLRRMTLANSSEMTYIVNHKELSYIYVLMRITRILNKMCSPSSLERNKNHRLYYVFNAIARGWPCLVTCFLCPHLRNRYLGLPNL